MGPEIEALMEGDRRKRPRSQPPPQPLMAGDDIFDRLPDDVVIEILCKLSSAAGSPYDLVKILILCKRLNRLGLEPIVLSKAPAKSLAIRAKNWCEQCHHFLKRCVDAGNLEATYILGMISFYCMQERRAGIILMYKALIRSHAAASYSLAIIQLNGSDRSRASRSNQRGAQLVARSAALGHADGLRELGHCLIGGQGFPRNYRKGYHFLARADKLEASGRRPGSDIHPVNRFLVEWFGDDQKQAGTDRKPVGSEADGLELCSSPWCGRVEMRRDEFSKCGACERAKYCSRACLHNHCRYGGHFVVCGRYGRGLHIVDANGDLVVFDDDESDDDDDGEPDDDDDDGEHVDDDGEPDVDDDGEPAPAVEGEPVIDNDGDPADGDDGERAVAVGVAGEPAVGVDADVNV